MWITNTMGKNNKKSQKKTTAKNNKNNFYLLYNYIWSNPISQRSWPQCCNNAALWSRDLHSLMYSEIGRIEMLSNTGDWQLLFLIMIQCTWYYNIYNIFSIFGVLSFFVWIPIQRVWFSILNLYRIRYSFYNFFLQASYLVYRGTWRNIFKTGK